MGKQEKSVFLLQSSVDYAPYFFGLGAVWKSMHSLHLRPPV